MGTYISEYPALDFNPLYKKFFENFYKIADDPNGHDLYTKQFTPDATVTMGAAKAKGKSEILGLLKNLWDGMASCAHYPAKVFPFGPNANEVMLHGTLALVKDDGSKSSFDWAARAHLTEAGDGSVQMDNYQVYFDSAANGN